MGFDTYQTELKVIQHGESVLGQAETADFPSEYKQLLKNYSKLLKTTNRLVRMSDRSEERLKEANVQIQHQQKALEKAHHKLSEHAQNLEEKVKERTTELMAAQEKLEGLVRLGIALSMERQHARFMEMVVQGQKELTNADGGILFSLRDENHLAYEILRFDTLELRLGGLSGRNAPEECISLRDETGRPRYFNPIAHAFLTERTINVPNIYESTDFDFQDIFAFDTAHDYRSQSFLAVPLKPRKGEILGVLVLINARVSGTSRIVAFNEDAERFIEALASQAAVAQDNKNLMQAQTSLLDSIIQVLAGAIDTKSPYTGGHCARVPIIGNLLAKAVCETNDGAFADFDMTDAEWREFHLASWLHDCGKVTTPEYVVDKATKLETIYNRIHEIRMRFEILLRDETIAYLEALAQPDADADALKAELDAKIQALHDDFAFVADCNVGGEFMSPDKINRLEAIAQTPWTRHFNDRLGLSQAELLRYAKVPEAPLPATEHLLADKKEHIIHRSKGEASYDPKEYGINMERPRHLYNLGELYNLRIARGTLTPEEFFKIKEHAIHTLIMLEQLPFPRQLARVPQFAACHHETMIGTGYPRGLDQTALPVQARILAIADIFEALTASDRPYKKAKTLNEALRIMSFMRNDGHIDPDLFNLFLESGIYRVFAEKHLKSEQIDDVDIVKFLQVAVESEE
ncbi:HD domain-containing phosphohydrolase [Desulfovibrio inopinatus]|uniref:HD domain-containing phosphohydrolase n=1 Tax=Desulfovibrio inopinatus TaxID=102109 RepID=UPI0004148C3D|nr:HD domain-containing phosphohydrolase [Desulfovibrio inopinatus]